MFLPGARIPKAVLDFAATDEAQAIQQANQKVGGAYRPRRQLRKPVGDVNKRKAF